MKKNIFTQLLTAYTSAKKATEYEVYAEAIADIERIGNQSVRLAILSALVKIQIEKPALIPLTFLALTTSLVLMIKKLL